MVIKTHHTPHAHNTPHAHDTPHAHNTPHVQHSDVQELNGNDDGGEAHRDVTSAAAARGGRDVAQVGTGGWARRELPRVTNPPRAHGFQAVMSRSALNEMRVHGRLEPEVEVCGVLVGNVYHDDFGPYVHVEACIRGTDAAERAANVTFTADTWNHINDELERGHPGRRILGWYHTHPGFGIFLSEMDLFIHNNFFPEAWQVAYVYDPHAEEDGLFMWRRGQATRGDYLVDPDTLSIDPADPQPSFSRPLAHSPLTGWGVSKRTCKWLGAGAAIAMVLALLLSEVTRRYTPVDGSGGAVLEVAEPVIPPSLQLPGADSKSPAEAD